MLLTAAARYDVITTHKQAVQHYRHSGRFSFKLVKDRRKGFRRHLTKSRGPLGGPRTTLCQRLNYRTRVVCVIADRSQHRMRATCWFHTVQTCGDVATVRVKLFCTCHEGTPPLSLNLCTRLAAKRSASDLDSFIPTEKAPWVRRIVVGRAARYGWTVRGSNPQRGNKLSLLHIVQDQPRGSFTECNGEESTTNGTLGGAIPLRPLCVSSDMSRDDLYLYY